MDDMAQFQLPEEERRRLLFSNLMMGLGAGLLDSRGKNIWGPMSTGLLGGMQMGQQAIGDARRGMVDSYKLKREVEQDREQKAMRDAAAGFNQALGGILDQVKTDPAKAFQIYTNAANEALKFNDLKRAEQLFKEAEKYRAKYSATPHTVMRDGKPVLVQTSEYDAPRELNGFQPKPEIEFRDMGGTVGVFDKLTTPAGSAFAKSLTPEAQQQQKQWDQEQRLRVNTDQRAAAAARAAAEKVDAPPKPEKATDQQLRADSFLMRAKDASKILDEIDRKSPGVGSAAATLERVGKIPLVGGMAGLASDFASPPVVQKYTQAKRAWIRAKLRLESGAVIGVEEEAMEDKTFFPQPGDSAAVKEQKRKMRLDIERSMATQAKKEPDAADPLGLR